MRGRILIAAAVVTGLWAVARSKPASENEQPSNPTAAQSAGDLLPVPEPGSSALVASRLEAGHDPELAFARPIERKVLRPQAIRSPAKASEHDHAAVAMVTTTSTADTPNLVATPPLPATPGGSGGPADGQVLAGGGIDAQPEDDRGPRIIIRGGIGSPHDDCKIHGGGGGHGVAINSRMPPLGIGMVVNTRARFGGSGMPAPGRGRIR